MSEELLEALMKLFALASDVDDITSQSRSVVQHYLEGELNAKVAQKYVKRYEEFVKRYHGIDFSGTDTQSSEEVNDDVVLNVCSKINQDLQQRQKVVVLVRLIEYIFADENISDHELSFINLVSNSFKIPKEESDICLKFLDSDKRYSLPDHENILIISSTQLTNKRSRSKYKMSENLDGECSILRFPSVGMYVLRYFGDEDLYLNGQIIKKGKSYIVPQGSSIRNARVVPIYFSDIVSAYLSVSEKEKIVFKAKDIQYRFKGGNIGLHKLDIVEEAGGLLGIMGGSGTGKSTLLNVLNGNYVPTEGAITINGIDINDPKSRIDGVIGYVPQDDLLMEDLTVYQNLYYNTRLCFARLSKAQIEEMVLNTLRDLGLLETKDLKVGSPMDKTISGGQRKRLNIALELIREPPILFVDEPTSGLSSRDSENIMDLLKELSLRGKLIFTVIHQPSSEIFKMFDKLLILDLGGRLIYYGNPVEGISYFKKRANYANLEDMDSSGHVNPELIFNIIESKVVDEYGNFTLERKILPDEFVEHYKQAIAPNIRDVQDPGTPPKSEFKIPNPIKQFSVFVTRDVLSKLTNKQYLAINLLESPVLALLLSYFIRFYHVHEEENYVFMDNENIPAYLFMSVVVALFVGLTVSAEEIIRDQKIRNREKFLNLSNSMYLLSKILIMFSLSAIQTFTFVLVGNSILGIEGMHFDYWLVLFSTACFANTLGLNISASFNSAVTIYILIPFLVIPQLIFSGVIVKFDKLNPTISSRTVVPVIGEMMTARWAFEALSVQQFVKNKFEQAIYPYDKELKKADYRKIYWVPKMKAKVGKIQNMLEKDDRDEQDFVSSLTLLRNEIAIQNELTKKIQFDRMEELNAVEVNSDLLYDLMDYLDRLKNFYIKVYNYTADQRDVVMSKLNKKYKDEGGFIALKRQYHNESLRDLVTNKLELDVNIEMDGRLIQQTDPIYRDGMAFRSHFFAPTKVFFGEVLPTFWANVMVIWIMTLTMIATLYLDLLKKILRMFGQR